MADVGDEVIDSVRVGVLYGWVAGEELGHVYVPVEVCVCVCVWRGERREGVSCVL